MAPEFHADLRLAVFRLLSMVAKLGVSVMVTIGQDDLFTEFRLGQANISYLTDAIVALRYAEVDGKLHKFMSVVKVRGSSHSCDLRSYRITDQGLEVDELPTEVAGILNGGAAQGFLTK
jgi:circadian clock protein KaiC